MSLFGGNSLFGRQSEPEPSALDLQQSSGQDASESLAGQHAENMVQFWEYIARPSLIDVNDFTILVKELGTAFLRQDELEECMMIIDEAELLKAANLPEAAKLVMEKGVAYLLGTRSRDGQFVKLLGTLSILKKIETTPKQERRLLGSG